MEAEAIALYQKARERLERETGAKSREHENGEREGYERTAFHGVEGRDEVPPVPKPPDWRQTEIRETAAARETDPFRGLRGEWWERTERLALRGSDSRSRATDSAGPQIRASDGIRAWLDRLPIFYRVYRGQAARVFDALRGLASTYPAGSTFGDIPARERAMFRALAAQLGGRA